MQDKRGGSRLDFGINKTILSKSKRSQLTIFIIIAIIIVAVVALIFVLSDSGADVAEIPSSLEPPYSAFLLCLENELETGINLIETRGGYIETPDFETGSSYMPFSSELNFLGISIPYWYYVSGNNFERERVPSMEEMQEQLGDFIERRVSGCEFDSYYDSGFEINQESPNANILIREGEVQLDLDMDLEIIKNQERAVVGEHRAIVKTNLKELYDSARKVYDYEQENLFLEDYGLDVLRAYAPVDGVEVTCSPKILNADEVFNDLEEAVEVNTLALKSKGDRNDYFVVDVPVEEDVRIRFLNSRNWTKSYEVAPNDGNILISKPVGNQPGLGILGFCYIPYHFVYSLKYPVLVQVEKDGEIFQFPMAVIIQGNKPREPEIFSPISQEIQDLCEYKNTLIDISTYDTRGSAVESEISYECSNTVCYIGKTQGGVLRADFPQCINGRVVAKAEGYEEAEYLLSTNEEGSADIYLDRLYPLQVNLLIDGRESSKNAVITFYSDVSTQTILYPGQNSIELSQGNYNVEVYIYEDSSLTLGASIQEQCLEVPRGGLGGLLGLTEDRCFDVQIPEQIISSVLSGGGKQEHFLLTSTLERSNIVEIRVESLVTPVNLDQLQNNYILFEGRGVDLDFR